MLVLATNQLAKKKSALGINRVPSKSQRCVWLKISALVLLFCPLTSLAQTYDLKPESWFPLEVGSYWHYEFSDGGVFIDTVVRHAEKDTLIDGKRWVKIVDVYCEGPNWSCESPNGVWYRFTEDHYLLGEGGDLEVANADTVLVTSPRSIFSVNVPSDTLETWGYEDPVIVSIENNEMGSEADSTHLLLFARANYIFSGVFIYKIGRAQSLVGAVVGDLSYGDTSLINSVARTYDLKPENWFPLEVGSTWHYKIEIPDGDTNDLIQKAIRDSLIEGQKWTAIKNVYCRTSRNCSTETVRWYHFTEDNYLLINTPNPGFTTADTILVSQPQSVFAANLPQDTLQSTRVTDPVTVSLEINNEGNETDSTNFELFVTARGDIFFTERFIYRIGPATRLVGAVVGNLSYGDTNLINSVVLPIESEPAVQEAQAELDLYPNPFHRQAFIRFQPQQAGRYALSIYDVLGRHIRTTQKSLAASEIWNLTWSLDRPLPSSIYFIEVTRDGSILKRASLIHVQ